jgi:hypothetical protein
MIMSDMASARRFGITFSAPRESEGRSCSPRPLAD